MARKIVITSGKGGVGKTTICANLGVQLAAKGKKVALIDADIGLNNLDVLLEMENRVTYDIFDVASGHCRLKQALIQSNKFPSLYLLPSKQVFSKVRIDGFILKSIVRDFDSMFDYVLIDSPAGIENGFHRAVFCADEALIVLTPHLSSIRDADKVITVLSGYNIKNKQLIVNRVRADLIIDSKNIDVYSIEKLLKIELIGVVPDEDKYQIKVQPEKNGPFNILANNIINGETYIYNYMEKYMGFIGGIKKIFKMRG